MIRRPPRSTRTDTLSLHDALPIFTQELRRRAVARMTDATYWKKYVREHKDEVEDGLKSGLVRSITVESANRLEISGRVYKYAVDFTQTDQRNGAVGETKKGRAYLNLTTRPPDVHPAVTYEKPPGVTVHEIGRASFMDTVWMYVLISM